MTCSSCLCVHTDACPVKCLAVTRGAIVLCQECWLDLCDIAARALSGQPNEATEGAH